MANSAQCSFFFTAVGELMRIDNRSCGALLNSVMVNLPCKKTLEELKREAIAKVELRGYDVRGKTWAQIRRMLRANPAKRKSNAISNESTTEQSSDIARFQY